MKRALLLLVVLAGFVAGCESKYKDPDPQAMGYDYYPLEVGNYRVYNVKEVIYFGDVPNTLSYQLMERVDTSFYDQTNQLVYKIIRSKRSDAGDAWLDDSVMIAAKTPNMVLLMKDNTKYVKLVFPVKEGGEWIADLYNTRTAAEGRNSKVRNGKEVYTFRSVGQPYQLNGDAFSGTVTVVQNGEDSNSTLVDERFEVYAEGVGLVHKRFKRIRLECTATICDDADSYKITGGHDKEEILIDHGKL